MSTRCLVVGASGQLGRALCASLQERYEVIPSTSRAAQSGQVHLDLAQPSDAARIVRDLKPAWIFLAGAFCHVDGCEEQPQHCRRINVEGSSAVAEAGRACGAAVVYYSTDSVFDGQAARYAETDPVSPLNVYARSKADGEAAIRAAQPKRHLIIRTAWLYGPDAAQRNFVLRLVASLSSGAPVRVADDQEGTPTWTEDLARISRWLLETGHGGTFHAAGPDCLSRYALAQAVCRCFGLDARLVQPARSSELGQAAARPRRVQLDCGRLLALGAPALRGVEQGLEALRAWRLASVT